MPLPVGSIISQSVKNLNTQYKQTVNYLDLSYKTPAPGAISIDVRYGQVLVNDLQIWLQSTLGDYYRRPTFGGFFDNVRNYPLTPAGGQQLGSDLNAAIAAQFPTIKILLLSVDPDYQNIGWKIKIVAQDTLTGYTGAVSQGIAATQ